MTAFSSRGPSLGVEGNLLKPDIAAPGVAMLAAVAPPSNRNRKFDFYSGTSMSSPHIAGVAALYFGKRPNVEPDGGEVGHDDEHRGGPRTPTARRTRTGTPKVPATSGPTGCSTPGVIFDAGDEDWLNFLEGFGYELGPIASPIDPSDYNSPSIAVGKLVGTKTVTRRVTAVTPGIYRLDISLPGVATSVSPSTLVFKTRVADQDGQDQAGPDVGTAGEAAFGRSPCAVAA